MLVQGMLLRVVGSMVTSNKGRWIIVEGSWEVLRHLQTRAQFLALMVASSGTVGRGPIRSEDIGRRGVCLGRYSLS